MNGTDEAAAARLQDQLATAQQITHIGSWEWDLTTDRVTWSDELYRIYGLEPQSCSITLGFFLDKLHPDDRARVHAEVRRALENEARFAYPERIVRPDGTVRELDTVGEVVRDSDGRPLGLIGTCRDVTEENRAKRLQTAEQRILEMIASGTAIHMVLGSIALMIEEQAPATLASILLVDELGTRVRHGAAPSLPGEYNRAIDGAEIGPSAGSCGTAVYRRQPVIVTDIAADPLWADYRDIAARFGLRACWSTPIFASDGRVLGTFALYYREPRHPGPDELELITRATHVAGIAIERKQLDDQLRALSTHIEAVREDERTAVAREIHDELGQALTALKMDLVWVARRAQQSDRPPESGPEGLSEKLRKMSQMTDEIIEQVRRISAELRPGVLDDLGLLAAMEWQAQEFEKRTGTPCVLSAEVGDIELDRNHATNLFRIFQESLTNITRHAQASRVEVDLTIAEGRLRLEIRDDGRGIPAHLIASPRSLGLLGIRERARRLGGSAKVVSGTTEGGTTVCVDVPIATDGGTS